MESFIVFRQICEELRQESSLNLKKKIIQKYFSYNSSNFNKTIAPKKDDMFFWYSLFLPKTNDFIYNISDKQLINCFSIIFNVDKDNMLKTLETINVDEVIAAYFQSDLKYSILSVKDVYHFLVRLSKITHKEEFIQFFTEISSKTTKKDLKCIIRIIKKDLRIGTGAKQFIDSLYPGAWDTFSRMNNLQLFIDSYIKKKSQTQEVEHLIPEDDGVILGQPIQPMLAAPMKNISLLLKKYSKKIFSEVKYDGERIQIHKLNNRDYLYYSRNLKKMPKNKTVEIYKPIRNIHGDTWIIDGELVVYCHDEQKILPFGTIGVHKRKERPNSTLCVIVFDILFLNGKSFMNKSFIERRNCLETLFKPMEGVLMLSEVCETNTKEEIEDFFQKEAIEKNQEGIMIKSGDGVYGPNKRHWYKLKKDYIGEGTLADSADLIILGAWYGNGKNSHLLTSFLMGTFDMETKKFLGVTKCSNGFSDEAFLKLQTQFQWEGFTHKLSHKYNMNLQGVKDFPNMILDPKKSQIWEIIGASFILNSPTYIGGISIRFPRFIRVRKDKDISSITTLDQLRAMVNL